LLTGFTVYSSDRILERTDGLCQIVGLGIQVSLALGRSPELVKRRQIDCTKLGDFPRQPGHFPLQGAFLGVGCQQRRQRGFIRTRLNQPLVELGRSQLRGLHRQTQFGHPGTDRAGLLLCAHAQLFGLAQCRRCLFERITPCRKRRLTAAAQAQRRLQGIATANIVGHLQFLLTQGLFGNDTLKLFRSQLQVACNVFELARAFALGEARLL